MILCQWKKDTFGYRLIAWCLYTDAAVFLAFWTRCLFSALFPSYTMFYLSFKRVGHVEQIGLVPWFVEGGCLENVRRNKMSIRRSSGDIWKKVSLLSYSGSTHCYLTTYLCSTNVHVYRLYNTNNLLVKEGNE